jgi:hypothetical protein
MKKIYYLFLILPFFLISCTTTWDTRRQELTQAYQSGKLSAEDYFRLKIETDKEESAFWDNFNKGVKEENYRQEQIRLQQEQQRIEALKVFNSQVQSNSVRLSTNCFTDNFGYTHCN